MAVIRAAGPEDLAAIRAVAEAAYAPYVPRMSKRPAPMDADFPAHLARGELFTLEADGAVAGYLVTFVKNRGQFIENLALAPDHQGRGLGRELLAFAEAEAARSGCDRLFLYTNVHMTENLDFYPRLGYVETERVTEDGFDRVYFEKRLKP